MNGSYTGTVTTNEILSTLNKPDDFSLAMLAFRDSDEHRVQSFCRPFKRKPGFGVTSVNDDFAGLLPQTDEPQ